MILVLVEKFELFHKLFLTFNHELPITKFEMHDVTVISLSLQGAKGPNGEAGSDGLPGSPVSIDHAVEFIPHNVRTCGKRRIRCSNLFKQSIPAKFEH